MYMHVVHMHWHIHVHAVYVHACAYAYLYMSINCTCTCMLYIIHAYALNVQAHTMHIMLNFDTNYTHRLHPIAGQH